MDFIRDTGEFFYGEAWRYAEMNHGCLRESIHEYVKVTSTGNVFRGTNHTQTRQQVARCARPMALPGKRIFYRASISGQQ